MENKRNDRRIRYTKHVIHDALFQLLGSKSLDAISVTELCTLADVNRGTFYKYYADVPDLFHQIEDEMYEQMKDVLDIGLSEGSYKTFERILDILLKNKDIVFIMLRALDNSRLIQKLILYSKNLLLNEEIGYLASYPEEERDYILTYQIGGAEALLTHWVQEGMETPAELICGVLDKMVYLNAYNAG